MTIFTRYNLFVFGVSFFLISSCIPEYKDNTKLNFKLNITDGINNLEGIQVKIETPGLLLAQETTNENGVVDVVTLASGESLEYYALVNTDDRQPFNFNPINPDFGTVVYQFSVIDKEEVIITPTTVLKNKVSASIVVNNTSNIEEILQIAYSYVPPSRLITIRNNDATELIIDQESLISAENPSDVFQFETVENIPVEIEVSRNSGLEQFTFIPTQENPNFIYEY